ncbi:MAG: type II toxin-antitoxin system RelE/ParE family toxin [Candidatus Scalindua rubra]|uniref:Plasmid stabilization system protein n=1 Tax=Candidatus Scalindua brodae TaxID=237368 RepID=A0A0B0EM50_9BACT|nr:MAG: Plasmid stabilization system protein [Candidatus Scalindua brodae]MBZ0110629.1 type II toxin-antitoxin system RelE/ParE family toxin [Candidatus Scalindua rubra]
MKFDVYLISDAEKDIIDIYKYIIFNDSKENAEYVFHEIEEACRSLSSLPDRGHIPPELERIGVMNFKEIHFKPYRIIYEVMNKKVFVHCVLDGRRNLQEILEHRLIR